MQDVTQQINITYNPEQDRLLLKASGNTQEEFRLWLTRRYSSLLLEALLNYINKAGGLQSVSCEQETLQHFKQGAFEQDYKTTQASQFPLGETGALGFRINISENDQNTITLQLLPEKGHGLNLELNTATLFLLYNLIEQAVLQAQWNLPTQSNQVQALH